jgi:DNA repair exonuclease SbcCD ATPase subunit
LQYNEAGKTVAEKNAEAQTLINAKFSEITAKNGEISDLNNVIKTVNSKIGLYNQSKCPTCATPFTGKAFDDLKQQLADFAKKKQDELKVKQDELSELNKEYQTIQEKIQKIGVAKQKLDNGIYQIRLNINNLLNENRLITERAKASAEYGAVENIIASTQKQIDSVKDSINEKTIRLSYIQQLQKVYSLDGVLGLMVENWVPSLNDEIAENLTLLNFPYILKFDKKLNATVKDFGADVPVESLSEGEQTRLNVVTILALVKVIKKRMPSLNVMSFDETISTLDPGTSELLLTILSGYAEEQGLNIIVVSHTDLSLEMFDEIIEVEKNGRFSTFKIKDNLL